MQDADEFQRELEMEVHQRTIEHRFFVGWHSLESFAVSPAKPSLFYALVPVFWIENESLWLLRVPSPLCLAYYRGEVFAGDDRNEQRVQRMEALELVVSTLGAFIRTVCHGVITRYQGGRLQQACEGRRTIGTLKKHIWTLVGEYGIVRVLSFFDVDPIRGLPALAQSYTVN